MRWKFANGEIINVPRSFVVNDGEALRIMLKRGMGIEIKSVWNASESLTIALLRMAIVILGYLIW
ncbi:hypothetical protein [Roseofilum casamattae]|uniref:Uncharacterized protein n=1 Tax=Roseofilum casamattae BLCC-M143 TaxID=3022442 RepID=A0ABT7C0K5_9CYAN|nr:hypothetical protein [Roseofilum casamattae]MDJ1184043.1 hypothetical protein [Roseofilum casamattae BLCC-M143]